MIKIKNFHVKQLKEIMKNLNKELFIELHKDFPKEIDLFTKWIDKYKKRVNWNSLLGINLKFHDLPYEMQLGILLIFSAEYAENKDELNQVSLDRFIAVLPELFKEIVLPNQEQ